MFIFFFFSYSKDFNQWFALLSLPLPLNSAPLKEMEEEETAVVKRTLKGRQRELTMQQMVDRKEMIHLQVEEKKVDGVATVFPLQAHHLKARSLLPGFLGWNS